MAGKRLRAIAPTALVSGQEPAWRGAGAEPPRERAAAVWGRRRVRATAARVRRQRSPDVAECGAAARAKEKKFSWLKQGARSS